MSAYFSSAALRFMRGLSRNNDRVWFTDRKAVYQREVHEPMAQLCEDVSLALTSFAPGHVKPAHKAMMRIYTNLRFNPNKPPYKTHLGAWWGAKGMERTSGGGYYLHLGVNEFEISAGCFMSLPEQLYRIREAIAGNSKPLRKVLADPLVKKLLPSPVCNALKRAPKGFSEADPDMDLLRCVKWGVLAALPPETALSDNLLDEIVSRFRVAAPMVDYLNAPISVSRAGKEPRFAQHTYFPK